MKNVVLIGMPGSGKSTVGVLLAKALAYEFVDTDLVIQERRGKTLRELIDSLGMEGFIAYEAETVVGIENQRAVIATGGSVVYRADAMARLKRDGTVVYLDVPLAVIASRLSDLQERGVVLAPDQSLEDLCAERKNLYEKYADITIQCGELGHNEIVRRIGSELSDVT